jgi:predicted RNA binding protein YcfA (HicA-like mRNA interferase family)
LAFAAMKKKSKQELTVQIKPKQQVFPKIVEKVLSG